MVAQPCLPSSNITGPQEVLESVNKYTLKRLGCRPGLGVFGTLESF